MLNCRLCWIRKAHKHKENSLNSFRWLGRPFRNVKKTSGPHYFGSHQHNRRARLGTPPPLLTRFGPVWLPPLCTSLTCSKIAEFIESWHTAKMASRRVCHKINRMLSSRSSRIDTNEVWSYSYSGHLLWSKKSFCRSKMRHVRICWKCSHFVGTHLASTWPERILKPFGAAVLGFSGCVINKYAILLSIADNWGWWWCI